MNRTIASDEIGRQWRDVIRSANSGNRVVVESGEEPPVAVVSIHDLKRLEQLDERERREESLRRLRELAERIGTRNQDLTQQEIEELADRAAREALDDLAKEGKLVFERDQM